MKPRVTTGILFFLAGIGVYALLAFIFAVLFDGRGISRDGPLLYPAELLVLIPIALASLLVAGRD